LKLCSEFQLSLEKDSTTSETMQVYHNIAILLNRMDKIREIDPQKGIVEVESGVLTLHLEEALTRHQMTLGHFPQTILNSSVGSWLSSHSVGYASSLYGHFFDMILDIEILFADGQTHWISKNSQLLSSFGENINLSGIITAVRLRIQNISITRHFRGVLFPSLEDGLNAMRQIRQKSVPPPSIMRLYDKFDTLFSKHRNASMPTTNNQLNRKLSDQILPPSKTPIINKLKKSFKDSLKKTRHQALQKIVQHTEKSEEWLEKILTPNALFILVYEGHNEQETETQMTQALQICKEYQGKDLGSKPALNWYQHRYDPRFQQAKLLAEGAITDTLVLKAPWSKIFSLLQKVKHKLKDKAFLLTHFSNATLEGCNAYVSFIAYTEKHKKLRLYDDIREDVLKITSKMDVNFKYDDQADPQEITEKEEEAKKTELAFVHAVESALLEQIMNTKKNQGSSS